VPPATRIAGAASQGEGAAWNFRLKGEGDRCGLARLDGGNVWLVMASGSGASVVDG